MDSNNSIKHRISIRALDLSPKAYTALLVNDIHFLSSSISENRARIKDLDFVTEPILKEILQCCKEYIWEHNIEEQDQDVYSGCNDDISFSSKTPTGTGCTDGKSSEYGEKGSVLITDTNLIEAKNNAKSDSESTAKDSLYSDELPISAFFYSGNTLNCLRRADINTVRDLVAISEDELGKIGGIGTQSVDAIKRIRKRIIGRIEPNTTGVACSDVAISEGTTHGQTLASTHIDGTGNTVDACASTHLLRTESVSQDTECFNDEETEEATDWNYIPIEELDLGVRAYNALKRAKINTVQELIDLSDDDLLKISNLGRITLDRINAAKSSIVYVSEEEKRDKIDSKITDDEDDRQKKEVVSDLRSDSSLIESLPLSTRAYNLLKRSHIDTVKELLELSRDDLLQLKNLGQKTLAELTRVISDIDSIREKTIETETNDSEYSENEYADIDIVQDDRSIDILPLSVRAANCLKRSGVMTVQQFLDMPQDDFLSIGQLGAKTYKELVLLQRDIIKSQKDDAINRKTNPTEYYKPLVFSAFNTPFVGLSFEEIKEVLPDYAEESDIKKAVGALIAEGKIEYIDFRCYRVYPPFYEFLNNYISDLPDREQVIMKRRYAGDTLEAIARDLGITRERVRQIQIKNSKKLKRNYTQYHRNKYFDEDFYKALYTACDLPKTFWTEELGLASESYNYLNSSFKRGEKKPEDVLNDESIPVSLRYRLRDYIDRDKIRIDGLLFNKRRAEIEEYALRKFAQEDIVYDTFIDHYNDLLESNGIPFDEKLYNTDENVRSRSNKLSDCMCCLWKQGEHLRFYDILARDYSELYEALHLDSYQDTEVSTRKLMDSYPELMEAYDIRDPYELHNLLKKTAEGYGLKRVKFLRQPMLQFGEFDRTKAITDIIVMLSPVTQSDLIEYLYREYGYDKGTVVSYLTPVGKYYHNGIYRVDFAHIQDWQIKPLMQELSEDFYYIEEIKRIYTSLFNEADDDCINPYTLKSLGFSVNSNYVIQNYPSAKAFFTNLLTKEEVYDIKGIVDRYGSVQMFNQTYADLLAKHQIFRFEKNQVITLQRLNRIGVTEEQINEYCDSVNDFVEEGAFFTIHSLRDDGFVHSLDDLGFEDFFYASLLGTDNQFCTQRVFGEIVLYHGRVNGQFSKSDFLVSQLREYERVDLDDFIQDTKERFGIEIPDRSEVTNAIKDTELYYDNIMDIIYRDKSLYYADFDE